MVGFTLGGPNKPPDATSTFFEVTHCGKQHHAPILFVPAYSNHSVEYTGELRQASKLLFYTGRILIFYLI